MNRGEESPESALVCLREYVTEHALTALEIRDLVHRGIRAAVIEDAPYRAKLGPSSLTVARTALAEIARRRDEAMDFAMNPQKYGGVSTLAVDLAGIAQQALDATADQPGAVQP